MYIQRELEETLKKYLKTKEILAVIGPRQSGKSTLIQNIIKDLPKSKSITFEDIETLNLFQNDIKSFIEQNVKNYDYLFIDEIQYSKNSGKNLKYIYDTQKIKILISGSSATEISIHSIKYLVGRIFVFNLYPLSLGEYIKFKNPQIHTLITQQHITKEIIKITSPLLMEYLIYGGYPRVVLSETNEEKQQVLKNIYNTYFLKEIKEILQLQDDYKLSQLIKALSLQIGEVINYNELSRLTNYSYAELKKSINILEKTFICSLIKTYHTNKRTELLKSPKPYFFDLGLRNESIKNYSIDRTDKGKLYENLTFLELIKEEQQPKYWRTKSKAEVDFIIEIENKVIPLEVKSNKINISRSFRSFIKLYSPKKAFYINENEIKQEKIGETTVDYIAMICLINLKKYLS